MSLSLGSRLFARPATLAPRPPPVREGPLRSRQITRSLSHRLRSTTHARSPHAAFARGGSPARRHHLSHESTRSLLLTRFRSHTYRPLVASLCALSSSPARVFFDCIIHISSASDLSRSLCTTRSLGSLLVRSDSAARSDPMRFTHQLFARFRHLTSILPRRSLLLRRIR